MINEGMLIGERYEILGLIGSGGMADVYKARDSKLNRLVAVKVLRQEFRMDKTFVSKFQKEAQAAAGLSHPNIVSVYDVGEDVNANFIVMELVEGITLKDYIKRKKKLSVREATSIAIQVSLGLEAAHKCGLVHRDVKPQNIMISTDGKVKLSDFGIARAASSNTISSNVMGSVHYSSPEQVRGGYSDEKSDIYSLGITMYEMITGRVPFDGDTTVAIAIKHLQEEMVSPGVYAPDLPYSLEQIIYKCTQKSVDRRYSCMEEVIADLKHSLIDPQGDFVKLAPVNTDAKTVVISEKELGEIKHTPKQVSKQELEGADGDYGDGDYDSEEDEDESYKRRQRQKNRRRKKKTVSRAVTIVALLAGAAVLIGLIIFIGHASGLLGEKEPDTTQQTQVETDENEGMVQVPDLVGKTEEEAKSLTNEAHIGIQMMGEEASNQEKGRISSQDIPAGTMVQEYSTLKYYISKGSQDITIPDTDGRTGIEAQQLLEDMGLTVEVQKEYSDLDDNGYPLVDPGYAYYTMPEAGSSAKSGDTITLVISRGVNYGDSAEVPSVVGMTQNDAITTLGKFVDINIEKEMNPDIVAGEVISQNPEAYSYADPDQPITITISTGSQNPTAAEPTQAPAADTSSPDSSTDTTADTFNESSATAGGTWKCTQRLNTPTGYQGGNIRLELVQDVGGQLQASIVLQGQKVEFPYKLDITGASGISEGTLYLYEEIDGEYVELGHYGISFEKAE